MDIYLVYSYNFLSQFDLKMHHILPYCALQELLMFVQTARYEFDSVLWLPMSFFIFTLFVHAKIHLFSTFCIIFGTLKIAYGINFALDKSEHKYQKSYTRGRYFGIVG